MGNSNSRVPSASNNNKASSDTSENREQLIKYLEENMGLTFDNEEGYNGDDDDDEIKGTVSKDQRSYRFRFFRSKPDSTWLVDYHEKRSGGEQERVVVDKKRVHKASSSKSSSSVVSKNTDTKEKILKEHVINEMDPQMVLRLVEMYASANDGRALEYLKGMKDLSSSETAPHNIQKSTRSRSKPIIKRCKLSQAA